MVLFIVWLAYAVATTVWVNVLLWTVLPLGLSVYLFAERYPWRVILIVAGPLTLLTACSQAVRFWLDAPTSVAFAIYLVACALLLVRRELPVARSMDRAPAAMDAGDPLRRTPRLGTFRGVGRRGEHDGSPGQRRR